MTAEPPVVLDAAFVLKVTLTDCDILTEMQRAGRHASLEHVLAQALYKYAQHLQIGDVPVSFMAETLRVRPAKGTR